MSDARGAERPSHNDALPQISVGGPLRGPIKPSLDDNAHHVLDVGYVPTKTAPFR
jgi:hypothetical protein